MHEEAAFAINNLIKPRSVIPSHANEEATSGGAVISTSKTQRFIDLIAASKDNVQVHVPLSGVTMSFNPNGICVSGC